MALQLTAGFVPGRRPTRESIFVYGRPAQSPEPLVATARHIFSMTQQNDSNVKILFRFFSNVLDEWTVETMWAQTVDKVKGLYRINNIPFFASIASGDIVFAEHDDTEQSLTYRETVKLSGNSIVQVVIMDTTIDTNEVRNTFKVLGCDSEKYTDRYFVIEVPADKNYKPVRKELVDLRDKGSIDFAEPVLSNNHQY